MSLLQHTDNVEDRWEQILPIMYSQTDAFDGLESPIELEAPSLALNMQEQSTSIHELKESASVTDLTDVRKKIADKLDETELRLCLESECAYSRFQELPRGISQNEEQCQETLLIHESIPENFRSSTSVVDLTDLRKKILNKLDETDIRIYLDSESQLFRYSVFQDNENYMLDSDVQYQETLGSRESLDSQTMVLEEFSVGTMIESLATFQEFPEEINRATLVPSSLENTQYLVEPKSEDAPINQDEDVGEALTLEAEVGTPSGPQNFSEHSLILTHERELQGHLDGQLSTERQWQDAPSEQTVVRELPQCHSNSESQSEDISTHQSIPSNYRIVQETLNFGEYSECEPKSALQHIANPSHFAAEDEENEEIPETGHQINENIAIFEELSSSSSEGNVNEGARLHQEYGSTLGKSNDALQPDTTPESLNAVQMLILRQIPEGTLCLAASPQNQLSQHYSRFTQPELSEKMPSVMMQNSQYLEEPNWESTDPAFSQLEEAISTNSTQDSLSVQDTHEIPNSQVGSTAELLTYSISSLSLSEDEDVSLAEIPMIQYEEANQRIGVLIRQGSLQEVLLSAGSDAEILYPLQSSSSSSEVDLAPVNEVQMNSEDVSSASMLNSQPSRIHPGSVSRLEVLPADAEPLENTGHLEIVSYRLPQECHITDKEVRQPQFEVSNLTVSPSLTHQDVSQGEEVTPLSAAAGNESEDDPPLRRRQNSETDSPLGNEIALTVLQSRYLEDLGRQLAQRAAERVDSFKDIEYVHENITRPQIVNWFDGITAQRAEEYARYHEKPCILKLKDAQVECWGSSSESVILCILVLKSHGQ